MRPMKCMKAGRVMLINAVKLPAYQTRRLTPHRLRLCQIKPLAVEAFEFGRKEAHAYASSSGRSADAAADRPTNATDQGGPTSLSGSEIRERFLTYYESKGHKRLPSSSLVPQDPTVMLTIAGMLQFKPIFLGQERRKYPCATSTQKCIRTNDIENVGVTKRHHTFFEMLGNFSFGDYFKEEAIQMAWELSTKLLGLPADRVWISVYQDDEEAYALWRDKVGVPESRIQRLGAEDNFWASGATGPCGPCSEMYYDFQPEKGTAGASLEDDTRFVEFYNLVFMESNRLSDGSLEPLAQQNIDTGMGLERMAQILQGAENNYETDLLLPLVHKAAELAGLEYGSASKKEKAALKVIADHARAVTYLISDGVSPSNIGRGYVLRRLLRRAVMKGHVLGISKNFLPIIVDAAIALSAECDAEVKKNSKRIKLETAREEERFGVALEAGQKPLAEALDRAEQSKLVSGEDAFLLYDTYGFPLEITMDAAADKGLQVDIHGFEKEMKTQRQRSKDSAKTVKLEVGGVLAGLGNQLNATVFKGYHDVEGNSRIVAILNDGDSVPTASKGDEVLILLDSTPFYAESGGQIGDSGTLRSTTDESLGNGSDPALISVSDVQKAAGGSLFVHTARLESGTVRVGEQVVAAVNSTLRKRSKCNHTATHLLQAALKKVLPNDVAQQGSSVTFDSLRFDFNLDRPMKAHELQEVEKLVNQWIQEEHMLEVKEVPIAEAKAAGAVAMFGEKYGDVVRVVDVPGVSMELCGGTHVDNTAEIGAFKIKTEQGIASGIRRIEAAAGPSALDYLNERDAVVREMTGKLKVSVAELPSKVSGLQEELSLLRKQLIEAQSHAAVAQARSLAGQAMTLANGSKLLVARLDAVEAKAMQEAAQDLEQQLGDPSAVVLLGCPEPDKVSMVAAFSPKVVSGKHQAGKFIGSIAKLCGGGGGGRPNIAQAGGKDASKIDDALQESQQQLQQMLDALKL